MREASLKQLKAFLNRPLTGKAWQLCAAVLKLLLAACALVILLGIVVFTLNPQTHWMVFVAQGSPEPPKNYTGTWRKWLSSGIMVAREEYLNGKLDGLSTYWDTEGYLRNNTSYRNGVLHGSWRSFFKNGSISKDFEYADSQRSGHWISFHVNGRTNYECFHSRPGAIDGPEILGNTNGERKVLRSWRDGIPWDGRFWSVFNGDSILRIYETGQLTLETNMGPFRPLRGARRARPPMERTP
jgi:hypothetical protein